MSKQADRVGPGRTSRTSGNVASGGGGTGERIAAFLDAIAADADLSSALRHHEVLPPQEPDLAPELELPVPLQQILKTRGISAPYAHQSRAIQALRSGKDVVLATPTASGKSLVYSLPTLEQALADRDARAIFLFPLKALEQDQRAKLELDITALGLMSQDDRPRVEIYDGDTPPSRRKKIRENPPNVLITTPDMLHLGILPHHQSWDGLFRGLRLVVVDELHTYRGIFGSHVSQVLRRLLRVARNHGSKPQLVCASATVANPGELASNLAGRPFEVVESDGASRSRRHVLLMNPQLSPYTVASQLFRLAVGHGLRTIAFTKARRVTELMHTWIVQGDPALADKISSYRAGFLPEERREIERKLFKGDLMGVISTSALEMGIDVGGLDVCLLVGYPGSQIATWQRAGRVGRRDEALIAMIAQPDALDQYFVAHPRAFFSGRFEHAVLDPNNSQILDAHLPCAAAEVPLRANEPAFQAPAVQASIGRLEEAGELLKSESGDRWFASRRNPHRHVSLRSAGASYTIVLANQRDGKGKPRIIGQIGAGNVYTECHEGAIYLHAGRSFVVTRLELDERRVTVEPVEAVYFTKAISEKETEILSRDRTRPAGNIRLTQGRVKVTTHVTGFERRRVRGQELLGTEPLELPPTSYETTGIWLEMPDEIPGVLEREERHVMGGIHAVEHAALAVFPLFALCDRFDVAGISYTRHPQLGRAAVFFYDGHDGGMGLTSSAFDRIEGLLETTYQLIHDCACESGCPGCVHSPRCGNGNRPIDKAAALRVLELTLGQEPLPELPDEEIRLASTPNPAPEAEAQSGPEPRLIWFDLETQRSAKDVGGWHNAHLMRMALACTWDSREQAFKTYREAQVDSLLADLAAADLVIGFNSIRFDYQVLQGYTDDGLRNLASFDLLEAIHTRLGFRLALGHLGEETLGVAKSADGLQSLQWWKEGRIDEIESYCQQDVALLRDLFFHARDKGHLLFRTKRGERVRLPLALSVPELIERTRSRSR
ncbi:MAG: DEAD/DEAH box helicase [bacterium]|nr:DEAD/DEAH box helicase [bacterium]